MARSGGQRTNLRRRRRRYTTRSWLIPSSHVRVNASGGVLVLTQRITARAIQKFTHCALNTISKFPPGWPCLFPSSPKNRSFFPRFSPRFLKVSRKCRLCLREPALYIYIGIIIVAFKPKISPRISKLLIVSFYVSFVWSGVFWFLQLALDTIWWQRIVKLLKVSFLLFFLRNFGFYQVCIGFRFNFSFLFFLKNEQRK